MNSPVSMDFKDFDKLVNSYVEISPNRFVITFHTGLIEFYNLNKGVLERE